MTLVLVFVFKLLDGIFSTLKNIFLIKEKHFLSAFVSTIGTFFYLTMIVQLSKTEGVLATVIVCLANFIGTYLPSKSANKFEKDKLYIYDITATSMGEGKHFADVIRSHNMAVKTYSAHDQNMNKVLCCTVYCKYKDESKLLNSLIPKHFKYNVQIPNE